MSVPILYRIQTRGTIFSNQRQFKTDLKFVPNKIKTQTGKNTHTKNHPFFFRTRQNNAYFWQQLSDKKKKIQQMTKENLGFVWFLIKRHQIGENDQCAKESNVHFSSPLMTPAFH